MHGTLSVQREKIKTVQAKRCPSKGTSVHRILPFELFLREIWPQDRTKNYMRLTGAKLRTAKHRIAGSRDPDYGELVAILRSEYGFGLLKHIMGDARPEWFTAVERAKNLGGLRKQIAEQQRRLAQLEMGID